MASLRLHKVTSLDAELFDFGVQGGAFEAEAGGGAIFSADLPIGLSEHAQNMVSFGGMQCGAA